MRIGFVTPQISRSLGGIQNTSYLFAEAFSDLCEFVSFTSKNSEDVIGGKAEVCKSSYNQDDTINLHKNLIKMVFDRHNEKAFDFTFAILYPYALSCYLLKKFKKVPYGVMVHGNELMNENSKGVKNKIKQTIKHGFRNLILKNADVVFANSKYTQELCLKIVGCKKVAVIHPPIKYEDKKVVETERTYKLLSIGRLEKRKGFQYVIEAMPAILKKYPQVVYLIAGGGAFATELQSKIDELGIAENVKLLGRVSEEEKDRLYRECDYFVMPSFTIEGDATVEGFGIVYIEANMYGKFVIATRSGGIPDAIKEGITGVFVKAQNANEIAKTVNYLYCDEFSYKPALCIEWAKNTDIKVIARKYIQEIQAVKG